jgi:parallel beta-helix repeat protein
MLKRMVSRITLTLLLISMLTLAFNIQPVKSEPNAIIVPNDYPTIQEAINNANEGDTIYVKTGTYYENVVVNKTVSLIGEDRNTTIIDGNYTGTVVSVTASNVKINGFTIRNSGLHCLGRGIYISEGTRENEISYNVIVNNDDGIMLEGSSNNNIFGNDITNNNFDGIFFVSSNCNKVFENYIANNRCGISAWLSSCNTMSKNSITSNGGRGIELMYCSDTSLLGNSITNNCWWGIELYNSYNNIVSGNNLENHWSEGIMLLVSSFNTIFRNIVKDNDCGIGLYSESCNNVISGNNITNNGERAGLRLGTGSSDNMIFHNNFVNNTHQQAHTDASLNLWDDGYPSGGNYWSDYAGVDEYSGPNQNQPSSDGIGDTPYVIDENNQDHYPPMYTGSYHQLTVTSSPITGITFTINGVPQTTPYTEWLLEGSYTLEMPETYNGYVWSHWLEDGDPNGTKMITLPGTTWTGVFVFAVQPHGPEAEFEAIPDTALTGESIKFDASASSLGWNGTHEMPITEYRWDFDDGNKTTTFTPIVYHSFQSPGIYYVTLTVYAPGATPETDSTTHKVTITAIPVGGYSIPIKGYTTEKPLTLYLALIAILTASFTIVKRRKKQQS